MFNHHFRTHEDNYVLVEGKVGATSAKKHHLDRIAGSLGLTAPSVYSKRNPYFDVLMSKPSPIRQNFFNK